MNEWSSLVSIFLSFISATIIVTGTIMFLDFGRELADKSVNNQYQASSTLKEMNGLLKEGDLLLKDEMILKIAEGTIANKCEVFVTYEGASNTIKRITKGNLSFSGNVESNYNNMKNYLAPFSDIPSTFNYMVYDGNDTVEFTKGCSYFASY